MAKKHSIVYPVVPITESHAPSFRECLDTVAREKRYLAMTAAPPLDRVEAFVRENVAQDISQFVALDGERVIGWADIYPGWAAALSHRGCLGMGVLPDYRGQGLGRRLLEACIAKAWQKGLTRIELEVRSDNTPAIALYHKHGFIQEVIKRRGMRFDGVYYDAVQMTLFKPVSY
jgi:putative acetyltransferase